MTLYNPVGDALVSNNLVSMAVPGITYTKDYHEYSGMRLSTKDPAETKGRKGWNPTTAIFNANVGFLEPQTSVEQVIQWKLSGLAEHYGLNLANSMDLLKFNLFMEKFEISPGETTLEWVLTFPPNEHTFEELPIFKIPSDEDVEDYYTKQH